MYLKHFSSQPRERCQSVNNSQKLNNLNAPDKWGIVKSVIKLFMILKGKLSINNINNF